MCTGPLGDAAGEWGPSNALQPAATQTSRKRTKVHQGISESLGCGRQEGREDLTEEVASALNLKDDEAAVRRAGEGRTRPREWQRPAWLHNDRCVETSRSQVRPQSHRP